MMGAGDKCKFIWLENKQKCLAFASGARHDLFISGGRGTPYACSHHTASNGRSVSPVGRGVVSA